MIARASPHAIYVGAVARRSEVISQRGATGTLPPYSVSRRRCRFGRIIRVRMPGAFCYKRRHACHRRRYPQADQLMTSIKDGGPSGMPDG